MVNKSSGWKECPTCGGLSKDLTDTEVGQELKKVLDEDAPSPVQEIIKAIRDVLYKLKG